MACQGSFDAPETGFAGEGDFILRSGLGVFEGSEGLGVWRKTVSTWRKRWLSSQAQTVIERLSDQPRTGAPPRITPKQVCAIIGLVCKK